MDFSGTRGAGGGSSAEHGSAEMVMPQGMASKRSEEAQERVPLGRRSEQLHDTAQHVHDCCLVNVEPGGELGFKFLQLRGQLLRAGEQLAHPHEGPHHEDAQADGLFAVEDIGRHSRRTSFASSRRFNSCSQTRATFQPLVRRRRLTRAACQP